MTRYRIEVRGKRGEHEHYAYVAYPEVKPRNVQRLIDKQAMNEAAHEGGGLLKVRFENCPEDNDGFTPVRVVLIGADVELFIYATPIQKGDDQ